MGIASRILQFRTLVLGLLCIVLLTPVSGVHAETLPTQLSSNLEYGMKGSEVELLQRWLAEDPAILSDKKITRVFDTTTKNAVIAYQKKKGMITSSAVGGGLGVVGPLTRANLNRDHGLQQGGVAMVEGEYEHVLVYVNGTFVPHAPGQVPRDVLDAKGISVWLNPDTYGTHDRELIGAGEGYALGMHPDGTLYAKSPLGVASTLKPYLAEDEWHHVSVYFGKKTATFVVDGVIAETSGYTRAQVGLLDTILASVSRPFTGIFSPFLSAVHISAPKVVQDIEAGETSVTVTTRPSLWSKFMNFLAVQFNMPSLKVAEVPVGTTTVTLPTQEAVVANPIPVRPVATTTSKDTRQKAALSDPGKIFPTAPAVSPLPVLLPLPKQATTTIATNNGTSSVQSIATSTRSAGSTGGNIAPKITLVGSQTVSINIGASYTDAGATATDAEDGVLTSRIVVGGQTVRTDTPGTYQITYNVRDSAGLAAQQVTRTVTVNAPATSI